MLSPGIGFCFCFCFNTFPKTGHKCRLSWPKEFKTAHRFRFQKGWNRDQKAAFNRSGNSVKLPSAAALKPSLGSHPPVWHFVQQTILIYQASHNCTWVLKKDYISFKSHGNLVALALKGVNLSLTIEKGHAKIKIRLSRGERRSFVNRSRRWER